jgi:isopenicillin-N N-acyltransferase-like protein
MPILKVEGTAYEIGLKHGQVAEKLIEQNLEFYFSIWRKAHLNRERVFALAKEWVEFLEESYPDHLEEMKGISDGAKKRLEEIVALNARWELTSAPANAVGECTAVAVAREATTSGHTFIGQNWDFRPPLRGNCHLLFVKKKGKPSFLMHAEAGIIGHMGLNEAGIGLCVNFIATEKDRLTVGIPNLVKCREILESDNLHQILDKIINHFEGPFSINFLVAHEGGEMIDLESTPVDTFCILPSNSILTHTNHIQSERISVKDIGKGVLPDRLIRSERASKLLEAKHSVEISDIFDVLRDHFDYPSSICRHADERLPILERWESCASLVMDLNDKRLWYTEGPPCLSEYQSIGLVTLAQVDKTAPKIGRA